MSSGPMTPRLQLPLLAAGQAHKELTHNEALVLIEALLIGSALGIATAPPTALVAGDLWIVGANPTGIWALSAHMLALWTSGGWRYVTAPPGTLIRLASSGAQLRRSAEGWAMPTSIAASTGGSVIDVQCRATVESLRQTLITAGLITI